MGEQIKTAANKGARYLVIAGEDELKDGQILLRDLVKKEQIKISFDQDSLIKEVMKDRL